MGIWDRLFNRPKRQEPEKAFVVTITTSFIQVEHPELETCKIHWSDIQRIKLRNTDSGPWMPDIWLTLVGKEVICVIPHGAKGFDEVYDIVSKYEGFNFENFAKSMGCTGNAEFDLWAKD